MSGHLAAGLARYFSEKQRAALAVAHVGIIGAGGLGSNVAMMLVRSGIRTLTVADHDMVEASNLNRQQFLPGDVGLPKVTALERCLKALEPDLGFVAHHCRVTGESAPRLFAACGIVVEAVDDAAAKAMLYEAFAGRVGLYVTASGLAGFGSAGGRAMTVRAGQGVVRVGDFSSAVDDANPPLAPRVMQAAALQADAVLEHILSPVAA